MRGCRRPLLIPTGSWPPIQRLFFSPQTWSLYNCPALRWPYFLLHTCPSTPDPRPAHPSPVQAPSRRGPPWRREGWTKGLGDQLLLPKRGQVPHWAREDELSLDQEYVKSRPRRQGVEKPSWACADSATSVPSPLWGLEKNKPPREKAYNHPDRQQKVIRQHLVIPNEKSSLKQMDVSGI